MASAKVKPSASPDDDGFFMIDDIDLSDESELRHVVAEVESLVGVPGKGLRISILSAEQWSTVLTRWLPPARRQAAMLHMHALRDPADHQHLVVSPSCVRGINERQANIYEELIYWVLRCLPTSLPKGILHTGSNDLLARLCGDRMNMKLYARHNPIEVDLVRGLVAVLRTEHDHSEDDWVLLLRRDPERFFLALRKTKFATEWLAFVRRNDELSECLTSADNARVALIELLAEAQTVKTPFIKLTEESLKHYLGNHARA